MSISDKLLKFGARDHNGVAAPLSLTEDGSLKIRDEGTAQKLAALEQEFLEYKLLFMPHGVSNAGFRNSIYRGKFLGEEVTPEQWQVIENGTFEDMYIGDYWIRNGTKYIIAAFNYYLNAGDTALTTNHLTLITEGVMYTHQMNSSNTTDGGYIGSLMYEEGLDQAKATINADFPGHVVTHRRWLSNATTDGAASAAIWVDSDVELMNEQMVYGSNATANSVGSPDAHRFNVGIEKSQLPLFRFRHDLIGIGSTWWLRCVASAAHFALAHTRGFASRDNASYAFGVRPVFSVS